MGWLSPLLARLGSGTLLALCATLFAVDLVIPDPVPFVDELILGAATLLLARWRQRSVSRNR
jgi:hypothetical protein